MLSAIIDVSRPKPSTTRSSVKLPRVRRRPLNPSPVPFEKEAAVLMESGGYETVDWDPAAFANQVEDAATDWKRFARPKPLGSHG